LFMLSPTSYLFALLIKNVFVWEHNQSQKAMVIYYVLVKANKSVK